MGGSISNPEKAYHLEFVTNNQEYSTELSNIINSFDLNSKIVIRKENYIVYLKEGGTNSRYTKYNRRPSSPA